MLSRETTSKKSRSVRMMGGHEAVSEEREPERFSPLEKKLLDEAQRSFPVCSRPYAELGARAGCSEQEAYDIIQDLRERGIIRRIGGIFSSQALGYVSELVAMRVPPERVEQVARIVNEYPGVTHNYEREGEYNLWFTIAEESRPELDCVVAEIIGRTNVEQVIRLPASRKFKTMVIVPFEG